MKVTIEEYIKKFYSKFPNSCVKIKQFIDNKILVEVIYGLCISSKNDLLIGKIPSIKTAINKNQFFSNKSNEIHNNKYDYNNVKYIHGKTKVLITCLKHGDFLQTPNEHLNGRGCPKCKNENIGKRSILSKEQFINKSKEVHKHKFDYSLVDYKGLQNFVDIICFIHGKFTIRGTNHIHGKQGCKKCGSKKISDNERITPKGWSLTNWKNAAEKSKEFDSFKIYILECWNSNEKFYKIGRTYLKINRRFHAKRALPYNYKILKEFIGTSEEIYKLEQTLKNLNKEFKYIPKIKFGGMYECFIQIKELI